MRTDHIHDLMLAFASVTCYAFRALHVPKIRTWIAITRYDNRHALQVGVCRLQGVTIL